jgi:serine/threonine-protein kinase
VAQPPETFGKYRIVATLGRGGMGEVYLAALQGPAGFNKLVVLKVMRDHVEGDERFKSMLLDEARLAARLRHPNVVQTLEVDEVEGRPLIAMEFLEGQPLNAVLAALRDRGERLETPIAARIVCEVLAGLHYAHELADFDGKPLGIVHRDATPHNIFVTYEGEVKLLDFGIAKATTNSAETEVGTVKGKVAYMAPEQARGLALDRRADIFAVGLVLWETLTSKRLLEGDSTAAILDHLLHRSLLPVATQSPELDAGIQTILNRALEKNPDDRYKTAQEMRQALLPFARDADREELGKRIATIFEKQKRDLSGKISDSMRPDVGDGSTKTIRVATMELLDNDPSARKGGTGTQHKTVKTTQQETPPPSSLTATQAAAADAQASRRKIIPWIVAGIAVGLVGMYVVKTKLGGDASTGAAATSEAGTTAAPSVLLRLEGSDTIGKELAPALAEAFLRKGGATNVTREADATKHVVRVIGPNGAIEIVSKGSATAFTALADGSCDVGMSSRAATADETSKLGHPGEHVVALDGVAIVVSPSSAARSFDQADLTRIFAGNIADWSELKLAPGSVHTYVREEGSGTRDVLSRWLGLAAFAPNARAIDDNASLASAVAGDPLGIGFVGMAYVANAKPIAVSAPGIAARQPTPFTVSTESYLLSRRLYLYTAEKPKKQAVDLVRFATSAEGQKAARAAGFVGLGVALEPPLPCDAKCPPKYAAATKTAQRLSIDFRFRGTTTALDSRGSADLDRLVAYVGEHPSKLALFGFSDAGPADSLDAANAVSSLLREKGIGVASTDGFGAAMPVAPDKTDGAHERNRRVEVWVKDDSSAKAAAATTTAAPPAEINFKR